jgi:hypothetical protein
MEIGSAILRFPFSFSNRLYSIKFFIISYTEAGALMI